MTSVPPLCSSVTHCTTPATSNNSKLSSLKLATYNVFFDIGNYKQRSCSVHRFKKQFVIFQALDLDVLFLNEATFNYVQLLLQEEWIQANYFVFVDPSIATFKDDSYFGNVAMCKKQPSKSYFLNWGDATIKHRPGIVLVFDDLQLILCGAHFKAFNDMTQVRKKQMQEACAVIDAFPATYQSIILGDLNFESSAEESLIRPDFVDLWVTLRPNEEGCTFDGTKNGTIQFVHGSNIWKKRLDRILVKNHAIGMFQFEQVQMFATEHVFSGVDDPLCPNKKQAYLHPSDHFGLMCIASKW